VAWFANHQKKSEVHNRNLFAQAVSLTILAEYEQAPDCTEAPGALNRWPGRAGLPIEEYFRQWEASCVELQANPQLPRRLLEIWRIGRGRKRPSHGFHADGRVKRQERKAQFAQGSK
jgi:hypothetical protein